MDTVLLPGTPLRKAVNYYHNHWDALMRFLRDPKIPMHNNAAERLFRALDTGRHNWLFAGSEDSAHNLAVLMGLVATCRLQGIDPQNYLAWAIERRGTWRDRYGLHPRELTPAAYKRALAAAKAWRGGHEVGLSASGSARVRGWLMGHPADSTSRLVPRREAKKVAFFVLTVF